MRKLLLLSLLYQIWAIQVLDIRGQEQRDPATWKHQVKLKPRDPSEQLKFWQWPGDNTWLDLGNQAFFAHENGPFTSKNIPAPKADLSGAKECS